MLENGLSTGTVHRLYVAGPRIDWEWQERGQSLARFGINFRGSQELPLSQFVPDLLQDN